MNVPSETSRYYDLIIIGGGINGVGIARDAAGRGLNVLLCEQDDLASATSSASSKLIHGGLRYLEYYEFRLVHEALEEREVLLANAPHLVKPMRFRLPHEPHLRPAWMIRAGLFLYDFLGKRKTLPASSRILLGENSPLKSSFHQAFEYSDCWADDARLVIANALSAKELGAVISPRTRCLDAKRGDLGWQVTLEDMHSGEVYTQHGRAIVNATGPWVAGFVKDKLQLQPEYGIRMIQGSHIVVPALYEQQQAYILQNSDKRIVFVIPWLGKWSLIGTTDVEYHGDPANVSVSQAEEGYLLDIINNYFVRQLTTDDIVYRYAGVRPLCSDESDQPSAITRDYTLTVSNDDETYPLLNIFGGKLTTYRKLAESALVKLKPWFAQMDKPWTGQVPLPGGDIVSRQGLLDELRVLYPWLPMAIAKRYSESYGSLCHRFLKPCRALADMGDDFGNGLYQSEVDYLLAEEWATTVDDILWRRTKTGLQLPESKRRALEDYISYWLLSHR